MAHLALGTALQNSFTTIYNAVSVVVVKPKGLGIEIGRPDFKAALQRKPHTHTQRKKENTMLAHMHTQACPYLHTTVCNKTLS